MEQIQEFMMAALPWLCLGLGLAFGAFALQRRKENGRYVATAMLAVLLFAGSTCAFVSPALANEGDPLDNLIPVSGLGSDALLFGNDLIWAGQNGSLDGVASENDILVAGQNLSIDGAKVAGSIRAAGYSISVDDSVADNNVTLAGYSISMKGGSAKAVALAASDIVFSGECSDLFIAGSDVTINGTVKGNARVFADKVLIGPKAVIDGTLIVEASSEPQVMTGAQVANLEYTVSQNNSAKLDAATLNSLMSAGTVFAAALSLLGTIVIALLCELFGRRQTAGAASMIKERTGATIGTGVVAAFVAPIVLIILCCLVLTLPVAGALALVLVAITIVGDGFMAAALSKIAFPHMNRWASMLIMAAIFGVVSCIPFVGGLLTIVAFMFMLGYILQCVFLGMKKDPQAAVAPNVVPA